MSVTVNLGACQKFPDRTGVHFTAAAIFATGNKILRNQTRVLKSCQNRGGSLISSSAGQPDLWCLLLILFIHVMWQH